MLPNPLLSAIPLQIWLGILLYVLILIQILTGLTVLKVPFWWHTKINWVLIIIIASIHGFYGLQNYFLK